MDNTQPDKLNLTPEESNILYSKITWRIIPLLFVCYIIAYIDRINVGFAKVQLQEVLGVDASVFGSVYATLSCNVSVPEFGSPG
jgi:sugar phosphate permease